MKKGLLLSLAFIFLLSMALVSCDGGNDKATVAFTDSVPSVEKRGFSPTFDALSSTDLYWYYTAEKADDGPTTGATSTKTAVKTGAKGLGNVSGFSAGTWDFALYGYVANPTKEEDYNSYSYTGTSEGVVLSASAVNTVAVSVNPISDSGEGKLVLSKDITIPAGGTWSYDCVDTKAEHVVNLTDKSLTRTDSGTISASDIVIDEDTGDDVDGTIPSGQYKVTIKAKNGETVAISKSYVVTVYKGLTLTIGGSFDELTCTAGFTTTDYKTVNFDANTAETCTNIPAASIVEANSEITLSSTEPERSGYKFVGWNTSADGSGTTTYALGSKYKVTGHTTLYAQWAKTYTITYDANGSTSGSVPTDSLKYKSGDTATAKTNSGTLAKTDCKFVGWNTKADGTGTTYVANASITVPAEDLTLYAKWLESTKYIVVYDANGGTGTLPADATYVKDSEVTVSTTTLTKTGYVFGGWNTQADGNGTLYNPNKAGATADDQKFTITADVTLYAKWIEIYAVTYDANGSTSGTVPTDSTVYFSGDKATVLGNTGSLEKTGMHFMGWSTNQNETNKDNVKAANEQITITANTTLYAVWGYQVSYVATGADTNRSKVPTSTLHLPSSSVTVAEQPYENSFPSKCLQKTGNAFNGWSMNAEGTGTIYLKGSANQSFTITQDTTLYATWVEFKFTVTDPNNLLDQGAGYSKTYDAEDHMTWETFISSDYNTAFCSGKTITANIVGSVGFPIQETPTFGNFVMNGSTKVNSGNLIENGVTYSLEYIEGKPLPF